MSLYVLCKVAGAEYAIPAGDVQQMESYTRPTPVPGSPAYVTGLIQVRQQVVPVIDLRIRFGFAATPPDSESRYVILKLKNRLVGLLVDSAREVNNFAAEDFSTAPEIFANSSQRFVKSVAQLKERIIMLIDGPMVIGEESKNG